jgi:hypothetical protein
MRNLRHISGEYTPWNNMYQIQGARIHRKFLTLVDLIDLLCLTSLSAIFQLYHGDQF